MGLAVRAVVKADGRKVSELGLAPGEASSREKNQQSGSHRDGVIGEASRSQAAQPAEGCLEASFRFSRPKSLIENRIDQARRRCDLLHRVQAAHQARNAGDHWCAVFARVRVQVELVPLVWPQQSVEI